MSNILFFDVETSGYSQQNFMDRSDGYNYQIVSIGMIAVDPSTWKPLAEQYTEIKWNGTSKWDKGAQRVHGLTPAYLEDNGVDEEDAFGLICHFLTQWFDVSKPIIIGGVNVSTFDRHFILSLFDKYESQLKLSGRSIDVAAIGTVLFGTTNSDELFEMFGVTRGVHNALEDAQAALTVARKTNRLVAKLQQ